MYNPNEPQKKQNHALIIGGLLVVIVVALALRFFIFPDSESASIQSLLNTSSVKPIDNKKRIFNADIIGLEKYKNLQNLNITPKKIEEIRYGKEDIFSDK